MEAWRFRNRAEAIAWRPAMIDREQKTRTVAARRSYSRPALTIYGSVRELTGGMSGAGLDGMSMAMN